MAYDTMMAEMGMRRDAPWASADVCFAFAMWAVMMVGMMAGAAAPVVSLAVLMFGSGYVAVWAGFSACAALAQWALHEAAMLSPARTSTSHRRDDARNDASRA